MVKVGAKTDKLTSLVVEGPVVIHYQLSDKLRSQIERQVKMELGKLMTEVVDYTLEGKAVSTFALQKQINGILYPKSVLQLTSATEGRSFLTIGRTTLRVGDSLPTELLQSVRLAEVYLLDMRVNQAIKWGGRKPIGPTMMRKEANYAS